MFIDLRPSLNCVIAVCYLWWSFTLGSIGGIWNWICFRDNEIRQNTGVRGRVSFLLIACEKSGKYRPKKKDLVRICIGSRKCGCPFKLCAKPVLGGEWWMKLICGTQNHEMTKSFVSIHMRVDWLKMRRLLLLIWRSPWWSQ